MSRENMGNAHRRWLNPDRKIAVTGLTGSGKTVFLLSLLENIERFNPERFRPAGGAAIRSFRELPPREGDAFEPFPRSRLRSRLIGSRNASWPDKTSQVHRCRCAFEYGGLGLGGRLWNTVAKGLWLGRRVEWEFLDFPGERFSDALMAKCESFSAWSDEMMNLLYISDDMREFISRLAGSAATGAELVSSYKRCLARLVSGKNQLITPSAFMLGPDPGGTPVTGEEIAAGGAGRSSGLPGGEFAPLSRDFRDARPDLKEEFSRHYLAYRDAVVMPLFRAVNDCDTLLATVDIPGILSGGVGRYNDTCELIAAMADNISPSGWFRGRVDRLALVAAKSDMVLDQDHDRLRRLADGMLLLARNRRPDLPGGYASFVVSAWVSAKSVELEDGTRALQGVPARSAGSEPSIFRVPEPPEAWPEDWRPEDRAYSYPRLSPPPLINRFMAPEQRNLEKVFDFIIS